MTGSYSYTHVTDGNLLRNAASLADSGRLDTAALLAHLAEIERRKLHLAAGYPSMFAYCVEKLRLAEDMAQKRLCAARLARRFPRIFDAIADGSLNLTTVVMLRKYLRRENATELLKAVENKSKSEVGAFIATRFPQTEEMPLVEIVVAPRPANNLPALEQVAASVTVETVKTAVAPVTALASSSAPAGRTAAPAPPTLRSHVTPVAHQRVAMHFMLGQAQHDKFRRVQELLGHEIPSGDMTEVFETMCDLSIALLEKRKFAATDRPRTGKKSSKAGSRHIPAHVKRAVRERDGDRCTYVSEDGHRCTARSPLEFDHIQEFARGGEATVENIRLRCRPHNQYSAEQTYGAGFMEEKRRAGKEPPRAAATGGS